MHELAVVAPSFVHIAHSIVWCATATVDRFGRPRSRIFHPLWEWDGANLVGWVATSPTPVKLDNLKEHPYVSCSYWTETHETCTAECDAEVLYDDATRADIWNKFKTAPPPLGYDPAVIPFWNEPTDDSFIVLRLKPWRLRVQPGTVMLQGVGDVLNWRRESVLSAPS
jgi:hypothetical protein